MADRFPLSAVRVVPVVQRRAADRLEYLAARLARNRAEGYRRIGRAERGGANSGDRRVQRVSKDREAVDITELTLIRGHAKRGVALGVFDAFIALAGGQVHVRHFDIVLEIEPHFRLEGVARALGHGPDRHHRGLGRASGFGRDGPLGRVTSCFGGLFACRVGVRQSLGGAQVARGGACGQDKAGAVSAKRRAVGVGAEMREVVVPAELAAAVGPEMDHGRPAARHGDGVAGDLVQHRAFAGLQAERDTGHSAATLDLGDGFARVNDDPQIFGFAG